MEIGEAKRHPNKEIDQATRESGLEEPIKSIYQERHVARLSVKLFGSRDYGYDLFQPHLRLRSKVVSPNP